MKTVINKIQIAIVLFLFCLPFNLIAQIVTQYTYGNYEDDEGYSICLTHDSVLIFTGYTDTVDNQGGLYENVYIGKIDQFGSHLWTNGYRFYDLEQGFCIIESLVDTTYEYVTVGDVRVPDANKHQDAFLLRTDPSGNVLGLTRYGDSREEHARSVIDADRGYYIVGYTNNATFPTDVYLIRTDYHGNMVWSKALDINGGQDYGYDIIFKDSSLYITGNTVDSLNFLSQAFLMNTDLNGNIQWVKVYGDSLADDFSYSLKETLDDGCIFIGHSYGYLPTGDSHVFMVKTDAFGITQWSGLYDFGLPDSTDYGKDVLVSSDSSFYGIGYSWVRNAFQFNMTIFQTNSIGNLNWVKSFGDSLEDRGFSGTLLQNTVVGFGSTLSKGPFPWEAYFVRTTQTDSLECVDFVPNDTTNLLHEEEIDIPFSERSMEHWREEFWIDYNIDLWTLICQDSANRIGHFIQDPVIDEGSFSVFPNPNNGSFSIQYSYSEDPLKELEIIDVTGRIVYKQKLFTNQDSHQIELPSDIESGIYYCTLRTAFITKIQELVLIRGN